LLFSETGGFVLEVTSENIDAVKNTFFKYGLGVDVIGRTIVQPSLVINDVINLSVRKVKEAWTNGLREKL
jgi:phosphoribosylformylglycinamidine synthase